eukprot:6196036-Pleurochrysis_carterae.AAC.1
MVAAERSLKEVKSDCEQLEAKAQKSEASAATAREASRRRYEGFIAKKHEMDNVLQKLKEESARADKLEKEKKAAEDKAASAQEDLKGLEGASSARLDELDRLLSLQEK